MKAILSALGLVFVAALSGQAQTVTASIEGKVLIGSIVRADFVPLTVAKVKLKNTQQSVDADSTGYFRFVGLRPGAYDLEVVGDFNAVDTIIQVSEKSTASLTLVVVPRLEIDERHAERDLVVGKPRLLVPGGLAPAVYARDAQFEASYSIRFLSFGCTGPDNEGLARYNRRVFDYLDQTYGREWRRKVRKDVIGLKKHQ